MPQGAVLVVFVMTTLGSVPGTTALRRAALDVLGPEASIRLEVMPERPSDVDALARAGRADGVVELTWTEDNRRADLHYYLARQKRWVDRTVTFAGEDAEIERARLIGFVVGSMLLDSTQPARQTGAREAFLPAPGSRSPVHERPLLVPRLPPQRTFELGAAASRGVGGTADSVGVATGVRLRLGSPWWASIGAAGRFGEIDEAQATSRLVLANLGVVWQPLAFTEAGDVGFGIRLDVLGGWLQVAHLSEDDATADTQQRWLFGSDALAEGSLGISESACLFLALGLEAVAGKTELYTHQRLAATIPVLRAIGALGVRTWF